MAPLDVFARMLAESRFEPARGSFGLEIELNLTDEAGEPAPREPTQSLNLAPDAVPAIVAVNVDQHFDNPVDARPYATRQSLVGT